MTSKIKCYKNSSCLGKSLAFLLVWAIFLSLWLTPFKTTLATESAEPETFSSGYEDNAPSLSPDKAFDGNTATRWASDLGVAEKYVGKNFSENQTIKSVQIFWERPTAKNYHLEIKRPNSDVWESIYHATEKSHKSIDVINLENPVTARSFRVRIVDFDNTGVANKDTWASNKISGMFTPVQWDTISIYEIKLFAENTSVTVADREEVVTNAQTSVTLEGGLDEEAGNTKARMIDGNEETRWATNQGRISGQITLNLGTLKQVQSMKIQWDPRDRSGGPNIRDYDVLGSGDGTLWIPLKRITGNEEATNSFNLDHPQNVQYIRLVLRNVSTTGWRNVSINEWEIYSHPMTTDTSLPVRLNETKTELVWDNTTRVSHTLLGTNADHVVDVTGKVYQPLVDTDVVLYTERVVNGTTRRNKDYTIRIPGRYPDSGEGPKPRVIPAVQQYHNTPGQVSFGNTIGLLVHEPTFRKAAELYKEDVASRGVTVNIGDANANFKIELRKVENKGYGDEGYYLKISDTGVLIEAENYTGAYYGLVTLLHIGETNVQKTEILDYPVYKERKFSLDTGRKFFPMHVMKEIAKNMAYYKMNTFQVHLNDNYIWLEQLSSRIPDMEEVLRRMDPGFRIETSFVGENGVRLTSRDHYTKEEFRDFVRESNYMGLDIVPEIDSPGHAGSFVKMRPELMYPDDNPSNPERLAYRNKPKAERAAMLNLNDPRSEEFVKAVFRELVGTADNPGAFYDVRRIHIGTDEYYGDRESYRRFVNNMLTFVRDELHKTPKFWGSLGGGSYSLSGTTEVTSAGTEMDIWSLGWNSVGHALEKGYKIVNILDVPTYSVPAMGAIESRRGGYTDFINPTALFNWSPVNFSGNGGPVLSVAHPEVLGGGYALWNDKNTDIGDRGLTSFDLFDRFFEPLPVAAQKTWSSTGYANYPELRSVADQLGYAPLTNPKFNKVPQDEKTLDLKVETLDNYTNHGVVKKEKSLVFNGESYIETAHRYMGHDSSLDLVFKVDTTEGEIPLMKTGKDVLYLRDADGYLAYHYDGREVQFDYQVEDNTWTHLQVITSKYKTIVYVNGRQIPIRVNPNKPHLEFFSFLLPMHQVGLGFKGNIGEMVIEKKNKESDYMLIRSDFTNVRANSEHTGNDANPAIAAIDGNIGTIWHTEWGNRGLTVGENNPAIWEADFTSPQDISGITYVPRSSGSNGNIIRYEFYAKKGGTYLSEPIASGTWSNNSSAKHIELPEIIKNMEGVKLVVKQGHGNFASAAEIQLLKKSEAVDLTKYEEDEEEEDNSSETSDTSDSSTDKGNSETPTPAPTPAPEQPQPKVESPIDLSSAIEGATTNRRIEVHISPSSVKKLKDAKGADEDIKLELVTQEEVAKEWEDVQVKTQEIVLDISLQELDTHRKLNKNEYPEGFTARVSVEIPQDKTIESTNGVRYLPTEAEKMTGSTEEKVPYEIKQMQGKKYLVFTAKHFSRYGFTLIKYTKTNITETSDFDTLLNKYLGIKKEAVSENVKTKDLVPKTQSKAVNSTLFLTLISLSLLISFGIYRRKKIKNI